MPTQVLRPNLVQDVDDAGDTFPIPSSATLVGTASTLWRDDNPATYVDATDEWTISGGLTRTDTRRDQARALLDPLTVDSSTATLNSVQVQITGEQIGTTSPDPGLTPTMYAQLFDPTSYDLTYGYMIRWFNVVSLNAVQDGDGLYLPGEWGVSFAHPDTSAQFTSAEVLDFFASGQAAVLCGTTGVSNTPGSWSATGRIYDVTVTIDYTLTRTKYPLRRHPRADGYGLGPKRHYPPPESRRKAGGYH